MVFLNVDARASQIETVERLLVESASVADVRFMDQQEAKQEFDELFADSPEMVGSVDADDLPASFRIVTVEGLPSELIDVLSTTPGVKDVIMNPCAEGGAFMQQEG